MNRYVSVILAVYNEEKYIQTCLNSLLKQDYQPLEIIVVDDGSKDNTLQLIKQYKNIELFQLKHQGTAISRNFGASKSQGKILVFVDADMEFEKNFISKLVQPIISNKTKGTFSRLEYVANWDKPLARCWNRNSNSSLPDKLRVLQNINEGEDFRAILKSEFLKVKGFDNTGYTDTWSLAKKLGYKPIRAPNAIYYHYNPESFSEVFQSACWIGKREYKAGVFGSLIALLRVCLFFSIYKGIVRSLKYKEIDFFLFQIVYDFGLKVGIFQKLLSGKVIK